MLYQDRIDRLNTYIAEDRLIRKAWTAERDGREMACLLAALSPEAGRKKSVCACPGDVMPAWLARLIPDIDGRGSSAEWPGMVRRFANLAAKWKYLDDAAWRRIEYGFRADCVREAMQHTDDSATLDNCRDAIALCERAATGYDPTRAEWEATTVLGLAWASSREVASAAAREASSAAARAAAKEVEGVMDSIKTSAEAWSVERAAAWDRLTVALFDRIENEIKSLQPNGDAKYLERETRNDQRDL